MKYNCGELIHRMERGERLRFVFFWGEIEEACSVTEACLSQWYPCRFVVDDVAYGSAEHYMMAQKALLFGDREIYEKIMAAGTPNEMKALGRQIRNFDQDKWDASKYQIVVDGNAAKFGQNDALKAFLLGTGNAVLAEASPYDGIWGIQLAAEDPLATDPKCWQGENLLGFALMEVRDLIRGQEQP